MLSKEATIELVRILKEDFAQDLTFEEAFEVGTHLVRFFDKLQELQSVHRESSPKGKTG